MTLGFLKRCLFIPNGSHASRSGEEGGGGVGAATPGTFLSQ